MTCYATIKRKPVRLRLSREKGFNLQAHSLSVNGLPAVNVARPTKWGNVFSVRLYGRHGAVARFGDYIGHSNSSLGFNVDDIQTLKGKNLACWCSLSQECHADILLEIANQ